MPRADILNYDTYIPEDREVTPRPQSVEEHYETMYSRLDEVDRGDYDAIRKRLGLDYDNVGADYPRKVVR